MITFDEKYLILKRDDIYKYLNEEQLHSLLCIINQVDDCRKNEGKSATNSYLVINTDELYAYQVAEIMERHGHCHHSEPGFFGSSKGDIKVYAPGETPDN